MDGRVCDHPGCFEAGLHRAPRGRDELHSFFWFCLDHVRAYNRSWNYCAGMSTEQIEADIRRDTVWRRPTWRFGTGRRSAWSDEVFDDPFGFVGNPAGRDAGTRRENGRGAGRFWSPASPEGRALAVLELEGEVTLAAIKARYKELVKKHHPDANGGCKVAEERLKSINQAYMTLRKKIIA